MSNELFIILFSIVLLLLFLQLIQQFRIHSAAKKQQDVLPNLAKELKIGVQQLRENMLITNTEVVDNIRKLYTAVGQMAEVLEKQRIIVDDLKLFHADDVVAGNAKVLGEWKSILPEMQNFSTFFSSINRYLEDLYKVSQRLDEHEARTEAIVKMGNYFVRSIEQLESHNQLVENARYDMRQSLARGLEEWNLSLLTMQEQYVQTVQEMRDAYNARLAAIQDELAADAELKSSMRRIRQLAEAKKMLTELTDTLNSLLEYSQLQTHYVALLSEKM